MTGLLTPPDDRVDARKAGLRRERFLAKPAEVVLLVMLATGLALFDPLGLPWPIVRWALVFHVAAALFLVPTVLIPFWRSHRSRLARSSRSFHLWSGRVLEVGLALLFLTGLWLLLVGWNGTATGTTLHWVHLGLSVPLVLLVLVHAWRYSALRSLFAAGAMVFLAAAATEPAPSMSGAEGFVLQNVSQTAAQTTTAVESRSLLLEPGGKTLLSANFDGGSVSRIDRATGKRLTETPLGGDLRAIAEDAPDGILAVTDYTGEAVSFLNATDLTLRRRIDLVGRPSGVVYDTRNRLFWIAATEGNQLYGVTPSGRTMTTLITAEAPRGLALLPDGRLLVSHATIGALSIYNTTTSPPKLVKLIHLAATDNPDQTVSQGLPRGLDRIAVSPDLKQAWLPHELWNFDHPFQFQSTVFPAISVISLTPGDEHEAVSRRKELFRQINIVEDGNRTQIVSNPADVGFSDDGKKAYATMSGSEDLVVFDLSRALPIDSKSAKAQTTQGASAVQIYRHLPGQEPRGLVVTGADIYVQNAQSLDLTRATTGGSEAFAQVSVTGPHFADLVAKDPLAATLRRGERLFDLANTSAFPDAPMTGDNWMSCSSCHLDGFNFTNRALFQATPVDKVHSAFTGHGSITKLVAGDFVGDYIRMIQNTQGGMGADARFAAPVTNPDKPSADVLAMMKDLHAYVTAPGNLPLLATWLRGTGGGGSVDPAAWTNSAICAGCHTDIAKQWSTSMHHFMAQSDPYYVVQEDLAAKDVGEPFRAWCMGCHAPQALLAGQTKTDGTPHLFDTGSEALNAELVQRAHALDEGTGCLSCHTVSKIEGSGPLSGGNASLILSPDTRPTYPFETSDSVTLRGVSDYLIRAMPEVHATSLMQNVKGNSHLCAACHEEFAPGTGSVITSTYGEWEASAYNAPDDPTRNRSCMDCHMHANVASIGTAVPGQSTDRGPVMANVVTHQFIGAQYHLIDLHDPAAAAESVALLRSAATLAVRAEGTSVVARVTNTGAGHALPTGVSDFREMWVQIDVTDASGKVVLTSGALDAAGNLDPAAHLFKKVLNDKNAHAVGLKFWRYGRLDTDTTIPANGYRDESYALPPGTVFPVTVTARLMFRTFPQWITDVVIQRFSQMPPPKPVEIAAAFATLGPN